MQTFVSNLGKFFAVQRGDDIHVITWSELNRDWIDAGYDVVGYTWAATQHQAKQFMLPIELGECRLRREHVAEPRPEIARERDQ